MIRSVGGTFGVSTRAFMCASKLAHGDDVAHARNILQVHRLGA